VGTLGISTRTVNRGIAGGFIRKVAMGGRLVRDLSAEECPEKTMISQNQIDHKY
jgi:hypothetical protein